MDVNIEEIFKEELDYIVLRLKNSKTKEDIIEWLGNFKDKDQLIALDVLKRFVFVDMKEILMRYDKQIKNILAKIPPHGDITFIPISEYGKSATQMSYFIRNSPSLKQLLKDGKAKITAYPKDLENNSYSKNSTIVFYDDLFGSGNSFNDYFLLFKKMRNATIKNVTNYNCLCLYYMESAEKLITKENPQIKIYGDIHHKLFGEEPMLFESIIQTNQYKDVIERYGEEKSLYIYKKVKQNLGHLNSQAIISFPWRPPNNTIPVIWSSNEKWRPLYPRFSSDILQNGIKFLDELAYSAAKDALGIKIEAKSANNKIKESVIISGILRGVNQEKSIPVICYHLSLSLDEIEKYVLKAIEYKFIDDSFALTKLGKDKLASILKQVNEYNSKGEIQLEFKDDLYIPKKIS